MGRDSGATGGWYWPPRLADAGFASIAWPILEQLPGTPQHALLAGGQAMLTITEAQPAHDFGELAAISAAEPFEIGLVPPAPARLVASVCSHIPIMTGIAARVYHET